MHACNEQDFVQRCGRPRRRNCQASTEPECASKTRRLYKNTPKSPRVMSLSSIYGSKSPSKPSDQSLAFIGEALNLWEDVNLQSSGSATSDGNNDTEEDCLEDIFRLSVADDHTPTTDEAPSLSEHSLDVGYSPSSLKLSDKELQRASYMPYQNVVGPLTTNNPSICTSNFFGNGKTTSLPKPLPIDVKEQGCKTPEMYHAVESIIEGSPLEDRRFLADRENKKRPFASLAPEATGTSIFMNTQPFRREDIPSSAEVTNRGAQIHSSGRLSSVADRLSRYSMSEQQDIVRFVKRYSYPTRPSSILSVSSTSSSVFMPTYNELLNHPISSLFMSRYDKILNSSSNSTFKDGLFIGSEQLLHKIPKIPRDQATFSSSLPGDLLLSEINTFKGHEDYDSLSADTERCTCYCCLQHMNQLGKYWAPQALRRYKRGQALQKDFRLLGDCTDQFGNTTLHVAAALGASFSSIASLIENKSTRKAKINAVNSAGQTFMHILNPSVLGKDIVQLLELLDGCGFAFNQRDVRGQTVFHALIKRGAQRCHLNRTLRSHMMRDSSGFVVEKYSLLYSVDDTTHSNISCAYVQLYEREQEKKKETEAFSDPEMRQTNLNKLKLINEAYQNPTVEDSLGRNALHVLADIPLEITEQPSSTPNLSPQDFSQRLATIENLSNVDINNYDRLGRTPLMAHILSPQVADESQEKIIEALIDRGANVNSRSSTGASPLHIALQNGRISGTKALLKHKANVHARDMNGDGILATAANRKSVTRDEKLYARIEACMALAIDAGAIQKPTLCQEWDLYKDLDIS